MADVKNPCAVDIFDRFSILIAISHVCAVQAHSVSRFMTAPAGVFSSSYDEARRRFREATVTTRPIFFGEGFPHKKDQGPTMASVCIKGYHWTHFTKKVKAK